MLWTNPPSIDFERVEAEARGPGSPPRIQFSGPAACTPLVLEQLNDCCERFGARLVVRFFGFAKEEFDAEILRSLPSVRVLYIDVHQAKNLEFLGRLEHLEEFGIGIFDGNYPQILRQPGIQRVRNLVLIDNRRNNVDLAPLEFFPRLAELRLCAHARNIEVLGRLTSLRLLALNQMSKSVRFPWIQSMTGLRNLTILLGSRADIDEVSHGDLERLRVDRIRSLERINLALFPTLAHFHMEDQLKLQDLDLAPLQTTLRRITIWNCKNLERLLGVETMQALGFLWVGKTKIDPEPLASKLPACLREATLAGYGKKRDAALKSLIQSRGIAPAGYVG
jgi:protein phosphatase 1 regulatory subunit 7